MHYSKKDVMVCNRMQKYVPLVNRRERIVKGSRERIEIERKETKGIELTI